MKRILVTGAGGQLGLTLKELVVDYPELDFEFRTREALDITDTKVLEGFFADSHYDFCINCAAYTNVERAEEQAQEAFEVNAEGVKNLARTCLENNVVLIHISTDYVFDGTKNAPYFPDDEPNPINIYGRSKLQGERYIQQILTRYHIVRTSWLYSKKYGKNFYRTILAKARSGEVLKVTNEQTGCPTNTMSLSQYLIQELVKGGKEFGIHHFSDGEAMTWYGFAKKILVEHKLAKKVELLAVQKYHTLAKRPEKSIIIP